MDQHLLSLFDSLLTLLLVILGGRVALHLILCPSPSASPSSRFSSPSQSARTVRVAFLSLVLPGEAALALHWIDVLTRRPFPTLELFLLKVLGLVCPLLFVTATVAYLGDRRRRRQNQSHHHHQGGERGRDLSRSCYGPLQTAPGEVAPRDPASALSKPRLPELECLGSGGSGQANGAASDARTERSSSSGNCGNDGLSRERESACRAPRHASREPPRDQQRPSASSSRWPQCRGAGKSVSERVTLGPFWTRAVSSSATTSRPAFVQGHPRSGEGADVRSQIKTRRQADEAESHTTKAATTASGAQSPPKAAEGGSLASCLRGLTLGYLWSVAIGVSVVTLLEPGIYPCFLHASGRQPAQQQGWRRSLAAAEEPGLYLHNMCASDAASFVLLYCAFYVPLVVYLACNLVQFRPRGSWSRGAAWLTDEEDDEIRDERVGRNADEIVAGRSKAGDLRGNFGRGSATQNAAAAAAAAAAARGGKAPPLPQGPTASAPRTAGGSPAPLSTQCWSSHPSTDKTSDLPVTSVRNQHRMSADQPGPVPRPAAVRLSTSRLPSQRTLSKSDCDGCDICWQVAPYVVLTTLLLLVQFVLVLPTWLALNWGQTGRVQLPSPVIALCPAYCAISLVFWDALNFHSIVY